MIDLHTHSNISDGTDSPEELIDKALSQNIETIALCDHDTVSGNKRFIDYASKFKIKAIPGIEISAEWKVGECHILGLNIDYLNSNFETALLKLKTGREDRNYQICRKLQELNIQIQLDEVTEIAQGEIVGRPHFALALVKKGYCTSIDDAFNKLLTKGAPAYVDRFRLSPIDAITMLKKYGAHVFLAHPSKLRLTPDGFKSFVSSLIELGLDGIEVYTPYTSDEEIYFFETVCREFHLKASGGSDYHGDNKPDHLLGYYREDKPIPENVEQALI